MVNIIKSCLLSGTLAVNYFDYTAVMPKILEWNKGIKDK
jgi:hypothetical protein